MDTTKKTIADILRQADPALATAWVRGWERPIQKCVTKPFPPRTDETAKLTSGVTTLFNQVRQGLDEGMRAGDAFKHLLRLLSIPFGEHDRTHYFELAKRVTFAKFLQWFKVAVVKTTNYPNLLAPGDTWLINTTRVKINDQFLPWLLCASLVDLLRQQSLVVHQTLCDRVFDNISEIKAHMNSLVF